MIASAVEPRERRAQFPFDIVPEGRDEDGFDDGTRALSTPEDRDRDFGRLPDGISVDAATDGGERL